MKRRTTAEDLIEYMLLEHVNSLNFISSRLGNVDSRSDIRKIGEYVVTESILSFGYVTRLRYQNIGGHIWSSLSGSDIFAIRVDDLFGEKVTFDIDAYRAQAATLKGASKAHEQIKQLIDEFGRDGFAKALSRVATDHKWEAVTLKPQDAGEDGDEPHDTTMISSLSQKEIEEIIEEISRIPVFVDDLALSQSDKAQALALTGAALALAQSPSPPWHIIKEIIYLIAAISTALAFVLLIGEKMA